MTALGDSSLTGFGLVDHPAVDEGCLNAREASPGDSSLIDKAVIGQ